MDSLYLEPSANHSCKESAHNSESQDNYAYIIDDNQANKYENISVNPTDSDGAERGTKADEARYETLQFDRPTNPPKTCLKCNKCTILIGLISAIIIAGLIGVIIFLLSPGKDSEETNTASYLTTDTADSKSYTDVTEVPKTTSGTSLLLVIGGFSGEGYGKYESHTSVDVYKIINGTITWSHQGKESSVGWTRAGRAVHGDSVYIAGSHTYKNGQESNVYEAKKYDVTRDEWIMLPHLKWGTRNGPVVFIQGDKLYSTDGDTLRDKHLTHELDLTSLSDGWKESSTHLSHNVFNPHAVVTVQGTIYVCGNHGNFSVKNLHSWNPSTDNFWKRLADMNIDRRTGSCLVSDGIGRMWIFGGCHNCWADGFMERYDIPQNTWTKLNAVPNVNFSERDNIDVQVCGFSEGFIFGVFAAKWNSGLDMRFHVYDVNKDSWSVSDTMLRAEAYDTVSGVIHPT